MVPEGWTTSNLAERNIQVIDGDRGKNYPSTGDFTDDGYCLFLSAKNVTKNGFSFAERQFVSKEKHTALRKGTLTRGDIVLTTRGTVGNIAYFDDEVPFEILRINSGMVLVRNQDQHISEEFLALLFRSFVVQNQVKKMTFGSAQPQLTVGIINRFKLPLPPLPEQRKIADILSTWDAAIEKTEALLATAKAQKRALMQSLLTGKRRFPEFEGQRWKEVRIGEVAHEVSERNKDDAALTVISCTKTIGFVNSLDYFKKKVFSDDLSGYKIIRRNQIGYPSNHVEEGSIGIQNLHDAALVSPIYTIFETGAEVDPMYLFRVLKTDRYRQIFAAATSASVDRRGSLRWKAFATIKVRLPSLHEQRRIIEVLSAADLEISEFMSSVAKLRTEKKALMQQLLTGKRRVTVEGHHGV